MSVLHPKWLPFVQGLAVRRGLVAAADGIALAVCAVVGPAYYTTAGEWTAWSDFQAVATSFWAAWRATPPVEPLEGLVYLGGALLVGGPLWYLLVRPLLFVVYGVVDRPPDRLSGSQSTGEFGSVVRPPGAAGQPSSEQLTLSRDDEHRDSFASTGPLVGYAVVLAVVFGTVVVLTYAAWTVLG